MPPEANPLSEIPHAIPFDRIHASHVVPAIEALPAGQARVSSWNGILLATVTTPSGNTCALPVLAPPGSYQAHFCWGLGHTGDVTGIGADSLADVRCEDKGFELGVNTDVVLQLR